MKVRNILIGLLVVLMAFVFISCEDEPEEQVQPVQVDDSVYKLVATKGIKDDVFNHDKFSIWFNEKVVAGQTISMEFRSTTDFFQMNVRGIEGMPKYVYEEDIKDDGSNTFTLEPLSDGWTKFTYTFDDDAEANDDFRVDFRGWVAVGDIMEIRHVFYGGKQIALSEDNMSGESYAAPTFETVDDHAWAEPETYVVAYFVGKPSSVDKYPVVEMVKAGEKVTKTGLSKDNYTINHIYNYDKSGTQGAEFDENTAINADTFLLVEYKGVDVNITFHKNYEGAEDEALATTTEFGQPITAPATDDWKREGYKIGGWTTAAEATDDNAFSLSAAVESTDAIEIYAQWIEPVTLTLNWNYGEEPKTTEVVLTQGTAPKAGDAQVGRPGWVLSGWTVGSAANSGAYNFTSVVDADKTIYAQWAEPAHSYKLTATQGNTDLEEGEGDFYDLDKFAVTFNRTNVQANPGDVLSFQYKFENEGDRVYKYFSIRGNKKWFSEKKYVEGNYPQSLSSWDDIGDGWYSCTYVFPDADPVTMKTTKGDAGVGTKDEVTYPAYFRLDIREGSGWCGVGDIIYIKSITLNGVEIEIDTADSDFSKFAAPTIVDLNAPEP